MDESSHICFVPVRSLNGGALVVQTGRLPRGQRVGIAFTAPDRLAKAMGQHQLWTQLSVSAVRAMLAPLGITSIQVDPILVGPSLGESSAWPPATEPVAPTNAAATPAVLVGAGADRA
jgi:hypothetical protein